MYTTIHHLAAEPTCRWLVAVIRERGLLRVRVPRDQESGSGDKQATFKLCSVEIEEVAVAFGPPAGGLVAAA